MLRALKCFDCFVFRHFISHFSDERLTSEAYPYQSALFLDDVIFFIVGDVNRSLIEILACVFILQVIKLREAFLF
jgi:hypothetical protein